MPLGFDSRIGIAGLAVGVIGIAIAILYPDKKWLGWIFLLVGFAILLYWGIAEIKPVVANRNASLTLSVVIGCALGGGAAFLVWKSIPAAPSDERIAPQVVWPMPSPINEGTPLSGVQLNAVSSVAGVFTYDPPAGTVLPVGAHALHATFHAADSSKYMLRTDTTGINVIAVRHPTPEPRGSIRILKYGFTVFEVGKPVEVSLEMEVLGDKALHVIQRYAVVVRPKPDTDLSVAAQQKEIWKEGAAALKPITKDDNVYTVPSGPALVLPFKTKPLLDEPTKSLVLEGKANFYVMGDFVDSHTHKSLKEFFFFKNGDLMYLCADHNN